MTSKRIKALLGLYALILLSAFVNGCCKGEYRLTGFEYVSASVSVTEPDSTVVVSDVTKVSGEFMITAFLQLQLASTNTMSLMNSSYAFSCELPTINPIVNSSVVISMDRSFILNGDSIEANTNLLVLENSGIIQDDIMRGYPIDRGPIDFYFSELFFTNSILENGEYTFTISALTEEGAKFESDIELEFEL